MFVILLGTLLIAAAFIAGFMVSDALSALYHFRRSSCAAATLVAGVFAFFGGFFLFKDPGSSYSLQPLLNLTRLYYLVFGGLVFHQGPTAALQTEFIKIPVMLIPIHVFATIVWEWL